MKDSYLELEKNVSLEAAAHALYADEDHTNLVNLGPMVSSSTNKLTNKSGKQKNTDFASIAFSICKISTSSKGSDDLTMNFC